MNIVNSEIAPGNYDVHGIAVLNFDSAVISNTVTPAKIEAVSKAAAATASGTSTITVVLFKFIVLTH